MEYVDRFWKIPVRMYEGGDIQAAMVANTPVPFRVAAERIIHMDIKGWKEMRFKETPEMEAERGEFPCTLVRLIEEDVVCCWPMKKFEEELRKFSNKFEEWERKERNMDIMEELRMMGEDDLIIGDKENL